MINNQGRILVIDDKKSDVEEFERVLRSEGYEVETTATAQRAIWGTAISVGTTRAASSPGPLRPGIRTQLEDIRFRNRSDGF
jgi:hypothetical protein